MKLHTLIVILCSVLIPLSSTAQNVGSAVLDKDDLVDMLKPQQKVRTRGIRLNQPAQQSPGTAQGQSQAAAEAPAAAPEPPPNISMDIQFAYNSANLTQQAIEQLSPLGQALNSSELAGFAFLIEGHTDGSGSADYNMQLSQKRAESVGNFLYNNFGIDPAALQLVGRGEDALLNANDPNSPVNRRVSVTTIVQ